MATYNRRTFMLRVVAGTAALAAAGSALADAPAPQRRCVGCSFYTPTPGTNNGTCAFAGTTVSADGGCGEFTPTTDLPGFFGPFIAGERPRSGWLMISST